MLIFKKINIGNIKKLYDDFAGTRKGGYLVVPRNLLEKTFETKAAFTPAQAYMYLYVRCEFCNRPGKEGLKRGQMVYTSAKLAKRFGWSGSSVRLFLRMLRDMGLVKLEVVPGLGSKLTLCFYEVLTGGQGRPVHEADRVQFAEFWKRYYALLEKDGSDYYPALSEWGRMSGKERKLAMERMERYFYSLNDMHFVKSAVSYLRYKAFLMPEDMENM